MKLDLLRPVRGVAKSRLAHENRRSCLEPETTTDDDEMAERCQKVATQTREDIEMHKNLLADFNQTVVKNAKADENPYSKNVHSHCEKYIKASEALPAEGDASAKVHTLRAKQVEGK